MWITRFITWWTFTEHFKMRALTLSLALGGYNMCLAKDLGKFSCDPMALHLWTGLETDVHNPYKANHKIKKIKNNWIKTEDLLEKINDYDMVYTLVSDNLVRRVSGNSTWGLPGFLLETLKAIESYDGVVYSHCIDYRSHQMFPLKTDKQWKVKKDERCFWPEFNLLKDLVYSDKIMPILASEDNSPYNTFYLAKDFTNFCALTMSRPIIPYIEANKEYDFVYAGASKLPKERVETFKRLGLTNSALVGNVKFKGWPNLTNNKLVKDMGPFLSKAKLSITLASEWHSWLTLRYWENFVSGSVMVVDYKYTKACEHLESIGLESRIVKTSDDIKNILKKDLPKLYDEQVESFIKYRNSLDTNKVRLPKLCHRP